MTEVPVSVPQSRSLPRLGLGWWKADRDAPAADPDTARQRLGDLRAGVAVLPGPAVARNGDVRFGGPNPGPDWQPLFGYAPPLPPDQLGDPAFLAAHRLRFAYLTGAMANGIGSADIVEEMGRAGMLGSFGAAGLSVERVTTAIDRVQASLGDRPYCFNLIHSPNEPGHEAAIAELYVRRGVPRAEASAYLDLTPPIVRYRAAGVRRGPDGRAVPTNLVIAKVSRTEVATKFLSPPPARLLKELQDKGQITAEQAELASKLPMCDDLTAEADSGGHTDNRPAVTLLPTLIALRDRLQKQFNFAVPVRVGLGGGIGTPAAAAAAFGMGAAFIVTGSVNQACVESGSSDPVRRMLAQADQADVIMAPAADMFEMGVKVQVLKRGTMFAMRGQKLYELYRQFPRWEAIPEADRVQVEKNVFRCSFDQVWAETEAFFARRDPAQLAKAADPRHKMALAFRWYLGLSSRWANAGDPARQLDYQVWCGPSMGAFNEWAKGSFLEAPMNRSVVGVARNLLYGAAVELRRLALRTQGVHLPADWYPSGPRLPEEIDSLFA